ncbi:MAG: hypothetical protein OHK0029_17570 [Armatimonadaceae bacterium]
MIEGEISAEYEMTVPLIIGNARGATETLQCVIDTGFSDYLSIPRSIIQRLDLAQRESRTFFLADNEPVIFDVFIGYVDWDGRERRISVLAAEGTPLIGMRLLRGAVVFTDVRDGGKVLVRAF